MVRRVAALFGAVALALALLAPSAKQAHAQGGVTWSTGFQVQNLGSGAATVSITLYNPDGTVNATVSNETIAVNGSKNYYPVPSNGAFNGSAVISATQPVASILNVLGNSGNSALPYYSEAASGIPASSTSTTVSLPLIMRGNGGFDTWFAVQNAGSADASVTVTYNAVVGSNYTAPARVVKPGASTVYEQAGETNLGAKFVGSATVTSSQPLAVVVNQVGSGSTKVALIYSGFAKGSNSLALPLVMQANAGYYTGIAIQNTGTTVANVTVSYSPNLVAGGVSLPDNTVTLQPGQGTNVTVGGTSKYVGSANVTTAAADQQVVAVVNQLSPTNGTAYEGIDTAAATSQVSLPLLMNANGGFFTGVQCRNLGTSATTITLTYSPNLVTGGVNPSPSVVANVAGGGTANIQQTGIGSKYVGSGTVTTSPASNVACIVNELNSTLQGDAFLTYNGINF